MKNWKMGKALDPGVGRGLEQLSELRKSNLSTIPYYSSLSFCFSSFSCWLCKRFYGCLCWYFYL